MDELHSQKDTVAPTDLTRWESVLSSLALSLRSVNTVRVMRQCVSTQDAVAAFAHEHETGWCVTTDVQTHGRGRRGSGWNQTCRQSGEQARGLGVAMSLTMDVRAGNASALCVACAGLGVVDAISSVFPALRDVIGVKWPNDVVVRTTGKKLAGCLVEQIGDLHVLGVGVNVHQRTCDFSSDIRARAISVCTLADTHNATASIDPSQDLRLDIMCAFLDSFDRLLSLSADEICEIWNRADATTGRACSVQSGASVMHGIVVATDPCEGITLRTESGSVARAHTHLRAETAKIIAVDGWCELG